ncbi:hypothetical protein Mgra_00003528, partial [Meloidogyne graminicola]
MDVVEKNYLKSSSNVLKNDLSKKDKSELIQLYINLQTRLLKVEDTNIDLRAQLLSVTEERDAIKREALTEVELQQIQDQIKQKDLRLDEMNNLVLAKERQIIDLQEMCNEQGQVAQSKSLAVHIVNRRLQELDAKQLHDVATETNDLFDNTRLASNFAGAVRENRSRSPYRSSPGRAFPQLKLGLFVKFTFKLCSLGMHHLHLSTQQKMGSSYTTETQQQQNFDGTLRKKRKKVNFNIENKNDVDFSPPQIKSPVKKQNFHSFDYEELITENDNLRQIIREMEEALHVANKNCNRPESQAVLKVKAMAQAKIRELEGMLSQKGTNKEEEFLQISELKAVIGQLKESREWVLEENAKLQEQLESSKQKCSDLVEEMDSSLKTTDHFRKKLDDNIKKMDATITELYQSRAQLRQVMDEKSILTSEIERLKEAIFAQDEFIGVLEGDLLVYEAHVGILRDSIGASKKEDRQYIKSKAFSAKINALEAEKEEICRKNNEEKLRAKAFSVKIRCLEEERDQLRLALRQYESNQHLSGNCNFVQPIQQDVCSVNTMTNDDFDRNNLSIQKLSEQLNEKTEQCETLLLQLTEQKQQNEAFILQQRDILDGLNELGGSLLKLDDSIVFAEICVENDFVTIFKFLIEDFDLSNVFFQKFAKIKNAFEELTISLNTIKKDNESLVEQIEIGKEENNLLKLKFEQLEDTKLKIDWELKSLWQKYTEATNLIENNNKTAKELEGQMEKLSDELNLKKCQILEIETENRVLEEEKASLKQNINSIEHSLSLKLNEERNKLEKLINLLNSIVDKFKSNIFDLNEKSLDEFINEGIEISKEKKDEQFDDNLTKINQINDFQKNILQLEDEIVHLKINLSKAEALGENLSNQNSALLMERETLLSERNNELLYNKAENERLVKELNSLEEKIKNDREKIFSYNKQVSIDLQTQQTQTELIQIDQFIQAVNISEPSVDAQIQCAIEMKSIQVETDEQKKICFSDVGVGDEKIISDDFVVPCYENIELEKPKKLQQQSHQLLKECIQDRQEFERDMDLNVQQLMELKTCLETSVEILKGEVWALNAEIKKRFAEQNLLKSNLEQVDNLVIKLRCDNDNLTSEVSEKNKELDKLKEQLKSSEKLLKDENENLSASIKLEKTKVIKLQNLLINFTNKNFKEVNLLRNQLKQLKEAQIESNSLFLGNNNSSSFINQLMECLIHLRKHKCGNHLNDINATKLAILAANLTIKNVDNEALIRENNELIITNAKLQNELDQILLGKCKEEVEDFRVKEENVIQLDIELENVSQDCRSNSFIINDLEKQSIEFEIILPLNNDEEEMINEEVKSVEDHWNDDAEKEKTEENLINEEENLDNIWEWNEEEKQVEEEKEEDNNEGKKDEQEENLWSWRDAETDEDNEDEGEGQENLFNSNNNKKKRTIGHGTMMMIMMLNKKMTLLLLLLLLTMTISLLQPNSSSIQKNNVSTFEQKNVKSLFDNWGFFLLSIYILIFHKLCTLLCKFT